MYQGNKLYHEVINYIIYSLSIKVFFLYYIPPPPILKDSKGVLVCAQIVYILFIILMHIGYKESSD